MGGLLGLIGPLIQALIAGQSLGAAFSGITIAEWVGIAWSLAQSSGEVQRAFAALHPVLEKLVSTMQNHIEDGHSPHAAATRAGNSMAEWLTANGEAVIRLSLEKEESE